jgi:hypothetical protein
MMNEVATCVIGSSTRSPVPSVTFVTPTLSVAGMLTCRVAMPGATTVTIAWKSITGGVLSKSEAKRPRCNDVMLVLDFLVMLSYLPGSSAAFAEGESSASSGLESGATWHMLTGPLPSAEPAGKVCGFCGVK